jgi:hypothetical protein
MKTKEKEVRKEQVLGGSFDKDNYMEGTCLGYNAMELRCLFLWFIRRSDKDGKNHCCFMPMVHMVIPWMPIFHQQDYPYSTEVLFMP